MNFFLGKIARVGELIKNVTSIKNPLDLVGAITFHMALFVVGLVILVESPRVNMISDSIQRPCLSLRNFVALIVLLIFGWRFIACIRELVISANTAKGVHSVLSYIFLIIVICALGWSLYIGERSGMIERAVSSIYIFQQCVK